MYLVLVPEAGQGGEGASRYQPADAVSLGGDRYRLIGSMANPGQCRFTPGQVVHCETREDDKGHIELLAVELASLQS